MIPQRFELSDIQASFRDLQAKLDMLLSKDIDLGGRLIRNSGKASSPFDLIRKFEVDEAIAGIESTVTPRAETALTQIKEVRIGLAAARPAASLSNAQTVYLATDTYVISYNSDGSAWASWLFPALLQFLGTTSSFPALKRSSAILQARLADDSAYTDIEVLDEAYDATNWNGVVEVPTKNALRDKIETLTGGETAALINDTAYDATTWNGVTTIGASKNAIRDYFEGAWTTFVPVFSSDIGNEAATFAAAVTVNLARYLVRGKTGLVTINYSGTLNAVTPAYIAFTVPAAITPANNNTESPAHVINNNVRETGNYVTVPAGPSFQVYRAAQALYTSAGVTGGRFSTTFEIA